MKVGFAIKPKTPVDRVLPYANKIDMALIMTVEPGFGGQKFMGDMMDKVRTLRKANPVLNIQVDGGISASNIQNLLKKGRALHCCAYTSLTTHL
ncbi:ribulose-phosphate 3 epimerase family protein [Ancylostoma duodenale]|uniref:Ribulose-phosphate 3 epimerase family protein n=1 Tax=Ancylostoma duodenale TaxID=51022 RepID=A0A0C2G0G6_9BILA|nr:ribulose-phosphate 3 epimerase family protein [Ancylostoma duodenale]